MMKVLVLPSWYPPRGGAFFREHSQALAAEGLNVTVIASVQTSVRKHGLPAFLWGKGIPSSVIHTDISPGTFTEIRSPYRTIPLLYKKNILRWISQVEQMVKRWIRANGIPDLIQVHSSIWAGVPAARISNLYGIPYVITEHRSRFVYNTPEAKRMFLPWHTPLLQEAFKGAASIVTVSDALQPKIRELLPGTSGKKVGSHLPELFTIPNMVDTRFFSPAPTAPPARPFVFFSLAHLEPVKGFDNLLNAMHLLCSKWPGRFSLVIGGDGSQRGTLEKQAAKLNLGKSVEFKGTLTPQDVKQCMQQSHAFVLSSRFEAFGVVFIEAMACGLPVIATRSGGPETFIDESCGLLVDPDQPEALATAMENMAANQHQYDRNHIWQRTLNHFSPKAIAAKYTNLYNQIVWPD